MGCLVVLLAVVAPRIVLALLWLFTDFLARAFASGVWAILGFVFLPTTTIAYAIARNELSTASGGLQASGILVIVLGVALDLGLLGGSGRGLGRRRG